MRTLAHNSEKLTAVEAQTGQVHQMPVKVGCGDTPYCLITAGKQLVIGGVDDTELYDPSKSGPSRLTKLGSGWISIPSVDPGTVWIGILATGASGHKARRLSAFREIDLNGKTLRSVTPRDGRWPVLASTRGLVYETDQGAALVRPFAAGRPSIRLPGSPRGAYGSLIATCGDPCTAWRVTDLASDSVETFQPPAGYIFDGDRAEFSYDGSHLAFTVRPPPADIGRAYTALAVANANGDGSTQLVPGSRLMGYEGLAWSQFRDQLFFVGSERNVSAYSADTGATSHVTDLSPGTVVLDMTSARSGG